MKKILIMITLLMGVLVSQAQVTITTEATKICEWDDDAETFSVNCEYYRDWSTKFWFNEAETVLIHTTPDMQSTYYVDDSKYNEEHNVFIYYITSDVGNKYTYFVDLDHNQLRTMKADGTKLVTHLIKGVFKDE